MLTVAAQCISVSRSKSYLQIAFCSLFLQFTNACSTAQLQHPLGEHTNSVSSGHSTNEWPIFTLQSTQTWRMNLPKGQPFDASGLLFQPDGSLLTVDNRAIGLWRIQFVPGTNGVNLLRVPDCFTREQLKPFAKDKIGIWDCEGIARDEEGRLYLCEEANRWILRCEPKTRSLEKLPIDWSSVSNYFSSDLNASFEGIAIGNGKLYVANERSNPVIIVVDLITLKVTDHFVVTPKAPSFLNFLHYSDLYWFENAVWILCRQHRVVLKVDPASHNVLSEFKYDDLEKELGYKTRVPGVGIMEGLAVEKDFIWICTDNNGLGTFNHPNDIRPTLVKCRRPDLKH